MSATVTELTLDPAALALALAGATSRLAPKLHEPAGAGGGPLLAEGLVDEQGALTEAGTAWFAPLREPSYVFRIERAAFDIEAVMSYFVHLPTMRSLRVSAEPDGALTLLEEPVADVIYSGLISAAGIWPGTHPEPEPDAEPPDVEAAVETTLVVLREEDDGIVEHELSWLDLDEEGAWLIEGDALEPVSDYELYQRIPVMLHVEDR